MRTFEHPAPQRILVVEDNHEIRSAVVELLRDEGYAVEVAGNGKAALDIVGKQHLSAILLDLMLPVMDGWAFLSECRSNPRCRDIPIIVMSAAHNLELQVKRLKQQGVGAVIAKPFDVEALLGVVQRFAPHAA